MHARWQPAASIRAAIWIVAHKDSGHSLKSIARIFGRDHSTISVVMRRAMARTSRDPVLAEAVSTLAASAARRAADLESVREAEARRRQELVERAPAVLQDLTSAVKSFYKLDHRTQQPWAVGALLVALQDAGAIEDDTWAALREAVGLKTRCGASRRINAAKARRDPDFSMLIERARAGLAQAGLTAQA
ncbi:MAG: hypothetical protein CFK52_13705 [Chloracidobacterium sp. CP2_5A]|nr:MAG: hypothetical protein CFK52_13705 [Chloracidobacterium sp. CP2_5A]